MYLLYRYTRYSLQLWLYYSYAILYYTILVKLMYVDTTNENDHILICVFQIILLVNKYL